MKLPSHKPDDLLYNRRILAYYSLIFSALWSIAVLILWSVLVFRNGQDISAADLGILFGVPAGITGLNVWKYLEASKIDQISNPPADKLSEQIKSEVME